MFRVCFSSTRISQGEKFLREHLRVSVGLFHHHTNSDSCFRGLVVTLSQSQSLPNRNESHPTATWAGRPENQFPAENLEEAFLLAPRPFQVRRGKGGAQGTRGTYPISPSSSSDSSGKMHRIACAQPHLLLQLQLEDYATLSYKEREKGTRSDPLSFAAFQCSANILPHLARNKEAQNRQYSNNATCSPLQGALTATENNANKVPAWRIPPV